MYVCTKFQGNRSRDFGFRTRKPPHKFGVKSGLSQKRLIKYGKKYFIRLYVLRYPFIPTNPLLAAMRFFLFFSVFFLFFFLNFVRSSSLKPQNIEICFYVKLLSCKCNFVSRNFFGHFHRELPKMGPKKINF